MLSSALLFFFLLSICVYYCYFFFTSGDYYIAACVLFFFALFFYVLFSRKCACTCGFVYMEKVRNMVYDFRTLFTLNLFHFYSGICIGTAAQNHKLTKCAREHLNWVCFILGARSRNHVHTGVRFLLLNDNTHNIENGRNGTECNSQLWLLWCRTVSIFVYSVIAA